MRWPWLITVALLGLAALGGCTDLRGYAGAWEGDRVGAAPALRVGAGQRATLEIVDVDAHGLRGRLAIAGVLPETSFASLAGAEADALANLSFAGAPLRVFLAFVPFPLTSVAGGGEALAMVALYEDRRVEVRVMRGGARPIYAIFAMTERAPGSTP